MKLSEVKSLLPALDTLVFKLPNGETVPQHFHVTEIGGIDKKFIDCGGTVRTEQKINFQLWHAGDVDHRLQAGKLLNIIRLSEDKLGLTDAEVEVEYQGDTIGKYGLEFTGKEFALTVRSTACLAQDACGVGPEPASVVEQTACCAGGKC